MTIMILGASGFIGTNLTAYLALNHPLILVSRNPNKLKALPNTQIIGWHELEEDPTILKNVEVIINLCGQSILGIWTKSYQKKLLDSRIMPLKTLNRLLNQVAHKPYIICASGVGAYGYQTKEAYQNSFREEDLPKHPTILSNIAKDVESTLDSDLQAKTCYLRFGVVLSTKGGSLPLMKIPHYFGMGMIVGDGNQPFSWVSLIDVLGIIEHAIEKHLLGKFNVTAPIADTNRTFNQSLAKAMHRPLWLRLPKFIAMLMGKMFIETILQGQRVSSEKIQNTGYTFKTKHASELINPI